MVTSICFSLVVLSRLMMDFQFAMTWAVTAWHVWIALAGVHCVSNIVLEP